MAFSSSVAVRELPLFPLPEVVLFPNVALPLHVFEPRYRIMINTILQSDRRFGVLMFDPVENKRASVGCCAEVIYHKRTPDDRIYVKTIGQQRFRILDYVRQKPYNVGLVEWIEDQPTDRDLKTLTADLRQLLQDVVYFSAKLTGSEIELPDDIPTTPIELSYWVATNLQGVAHEQQQLLEMQDTAARLEREAEILMTTRNHLAAKSALKDAFK